MVMVWVRSAVVGMTYLIPLAAMSTRAPLVSNSSTWIWKRPLWSDPVATPPGYVIPGETPPGRWRTGRWPCPRRRRRWSTGPGRHGRRNFEEIRRRSHRLGPQEIGLDDRIARSTGRVDVVAIDVAAVDRGEGSARPAPPADLVVLHAQAGPQAVVEVEPGKQGRSPRRAAAGQAEVGRGGRADQGLTRSAHGAERGVADGGEHHPVFRRDHRQAGRAGVGPGAGGDEGDQRAARIVPPGVAAHRLGRVDVDVVARKRNGTLALK